MAEAKRDLNYVTTIMGVNVNDGVTPLNMNIDPANGRLMVTAIITSGLSGLAQDSTLTDGTQKTQLTDSEGDDFPIGSDTPTTGVATSSGDTTILSVAANKYVKLYHVSFVPTTSSSADVDVAIKIGSTTVLGWRTNTNGGGFSRSKKNGMGWWEGAAGEDVVINLSGADSIRWNLDYDLGDVV